jgi:HAD superfamily hydrolase (TIGR01509 family)
VIPKSKAVIWDMDGVIADTALYHLKAWQEVFRERGVNFTGEDFRHTFGQRNDTIITSALGEEVSRHEMDAIASKKEESFRRRIKKKLKPLPGVIELMASLKKRRFQMALASSAPIENIHLVIKTLGINDYFQSIICDRDVTEGKPSPQVFLLAAERLGVKPGDCIVIEDAVAGVTEDCIVIEDAVAGVTAAKRAGMYCLALASTHPGHSLMEADLVVDTLEAVSVNDVESLFKPSRESWSG